jgi:hypothetical protein
MNSRRKALCRVALVLAVLSFAVVAALAATKPSNKWRIEFDGKADNAGTIAFRIVPPQGDPQEVSVTIPEKTSENEVAGLVRDQLKTALGEAYHVERDDWEDVLVKVKGKTPDFGLELASTSVTGIRIKLKRE